MPWCGECRTELAAEDAASHLRRTHGLGRLCRWICGLCPFEGADFDGLADHALRKGHRGDLGSVSLDDGGIQSALTLIQALAATPKLDEEKPMSTTATTSEDGDRTLDDVPEEIELKLEEEPAGASVSSHARTLRHFKSNFPFFRIRRRAICRFFILDPNEAVLSTEQVLGLELDCASLRAKFADEEGGLRWLVSLGILANSMRCPKVRDAASAAPCAGPMSFVQQNSYKKSVPGQPPLRDSRGKALPPRGKFVDNRGWRCQDCRPSTVLKSIRSGTLFIGSHYKFVDIMGQLFLWAQDLASEAEIFASVPPRYVKLWVAAVRQLTADWCRANMPELDESTDVDFFALFREAHRPNVFQHLLLLIRGYQHKRFPFVFDSREDD